MAASAIQPQDLNDKVRKLLAELDGHLPGEHAHAERVSVFATAMGHELGLRDSALTDLRIAAQLHDIGKLSLNRELFLTDEARNVELVLRQSHADLGAVFVKNQAGFKNLANAVLHHHERWDGTGYPGGLKGADIPLGSRIIAVAESFDAMIYAYFNAKKLLEAEGVSKIWDSAGTQFDPAVVDAFLKIQPLIQPVI